MSAAESSPTLNLVFTGDIQAAMVAINTMLLQPGTTFTTDGWQRVRLRNIERIAVMPITERGAMDCDTRRQPLERQIRIYFAGMHVATVKLDGIWTVPIFQPLPDSRLISWAVAELAYRTDPLENVSQSIWTNVLLPDGGFGDPVTSAP